MSYKVNWGHYKNVPAPQQQLGPVLDLTAITEGKKVEIRLTSSPAPEPWPALSSRSPAGRRRGSRAEGRGGRRRARAWGRYKCNYISNNYKTKSGNCELGNHGPDRWQDDALPDCLLGLGVPNHVGEAAARGRGRAHRHHHFPNLLLELRGKTRFDYRKVTN